MDFFFEFGYLKKKKNLWNVFLRKEISSKENVFKRKALQVCWFTKGKS